MTENKDEDELPTPRKIVTYPIAGEEGAGAVFLFGDANAPNLAILCAGFPDDHENFLPFADELAKRANCLVGVTCMAGYDDRPPERPYTAHNPNGYSFDELTSGLGQAVQVLRDESTFAGAKMTGIYHDWGVAPGSMFSNRALEQDLTGLKPDQIVLFDVMGPPHPEQPDLSTVAAVGKDSIYDIVTTLAYRIVLASAYGLRRYLSPTLAQVVFGIGFGVLGMLNMSPTRAIDAGVMKARKVPLELDRIIYMAYPYYNMFKAMFSGNAEKAFAGMCLPKNLTTTPVLYMYGLDKNIMFHDRKALAVLEREEKGGRRSKAIAVKDAGHWLYVQQPEICLEAVKKFVTDA